MRRGPYGDQMPREENVSDPEAEADDSDWLDGVVDGALDGDEVIVTAHTQSLTGGDEWGTVDFFFEMMTDAADLRRFRRWLRRHTERRWPLGRRRFELEEICAVVAPDRTDVVFGSAFPDDDTWQPQRVPVDDVRHLCDVLEDRGDLL